MKISELVEELKGFMEINGDLEVVLSYDVNKNITSDENIWVAIDGFKDREELSIRNFHS